MRADTLESALARAYAAHPSLNAQRAGVRVSNEGVAQAVSGYRPRINGTLDAGVQYNDVTIPGARTNTTLNGRGGALQVDQTLWNGNRTFNRVRSAEAGVFAAREILRNTEQTILLEAATAYMAVLRDSAVLNLRNNNIEVLDEQLRQVQDRFSVGEVTRTDVAQAQARLAGARSQASAAQATLKASLARYRQAIGGEPSKLAPGRPIENLLPRSLDLAVQSGLAQHPSITSALHNVDLAEFNVKTIEGELLPTLSVTGRVQQRYDSQIEDDRRFSASAVATLSVPIYEGGEVYARARAAKETLGQRRLEVDVARDTIRANVIATGATGGRRGPDPCRAGAGSGRRDGAERRARGSQGRPAHHAGRSQRPAGIARCARRAHFRAAGSCRGVLSGACRHRSPFGDHARPARRRP